MMLQRFERRVRAGSSGAVEGIYISSTVSMAETNSLLNVFMRDLLDLSSRNSEFECFEVAFTQRFSGISEAQFAASEGCQSP